MFLRKPPSSRMSFPGAGRWQECAVWLHESSRNRFCKIALWQNASELHSREMLMFSNSSWQDKISEGDAEPFWTVTAWGKQKALCQFHCGQKASSHWEKREREVLRSPLSGENNHHHVISEHSYTQKVLLSFNEFRMHTFTSSGSLS